MSMTVATKGAATTFVGGWAAILGGMADLSPNQWGALALAVALSLFSGNLAALALIEHHNGHDRDRIARERRLRAMIFSAQFVFGMVIAAQVGGNIWFAMPACLAVGWTGTQFLDWLAKRSGFGADR